jgi:hypothetical protein
LDAHSAVAHEAPGNATYLFKEMAATCANHIERWPAKAASGRGAVTGRLSKAIKRKGPSAGSG